MKNFLLFLALITLNIFNYGQQPPAPAQNLWVTNGSVYAIAVDEGYTYLGGSFNFVGPNTGYGAKLTTTNDKPDLSFAKVDGSIETCVPDGEGGWIIGGSFSKVGNENRSNLARINADGSIHSWNPTVSAAVNAVAVSGNDVYIGGYFGFVNSTTRQNLAKLNKTTGELDASWTPTTNQRVYSIIVDGSDVYIGGNFTIVYSTARNRAAKLNNTDGTLITSWNPNADGIINSMVMSGEYIYIGGAYSSIGTQQIGKLARVNKENGNADANWAPNPNSTVRTIAINGNDIYAGGFFSNIGGQARKYIAKLNNSNGNADLNWIPDADYTVYTIATDGNDIYVGGDFTAIGGKDRRRIAKLNNTSGGAYENWTPHASSTVSSIAISGNNIYVGGKFTILGGVTRHRLAKISNLTGVADENWTPIADGGVYAIVVSNSDVYIGGDFIYIGQNDVSRLAKLNKTTGELDVNWKPYANGTVYSIALSGNNIYVGGNFTDLATNNVPYIAKLNNTNGLPDANWNPNANGTVYTIAIDGDDIYAGGDFNSIGGQSRQKLAKLNNTNGNAYTTWEANANGLVYSLALKEGHVYAGGQFTTVNSLQRNYIAKISKNSGEVDNYWDANANGAVLKITTSNNNIFAGGNFTNIGGQAQNRVAILNNYNGNINQTWNPSADGIVRAITVNNEDLFVGGDFDRINNSLNPKLAKFNNPPSPTSTIQVDSPTSEDVYRIGENQNIWWTSENVDYVDIEYTYDNGQTWHSIVSNHPANSGYYTWNVPNTPSDSCKVRITHSYGTATGISTGYFSIILAQIVITQPNGGEVWKAGEVKTITWNSPLSSEVIIDYSTDNGTNWNYIATTYANVGYYNWTIPNAPSTQCKIRIVETGGSVIGKEDIVGDTSDNVFTIELNPCPGIPTVEYQGKTYNTVQIGDQCWLRENLNVGVMISGSFDQTNNSIIEKYCYDNDTSNCNTYGGLYQWNEAMQYSATPGTKGICPTGWHIPTLAENQTLAASVSNDGNSLKAIGQGYGDGSGINNSGFSALLSGGREPNPVFYNINYATYFWSSSTVDASNASRNMVLTSYDDDIYLGDYDRNQAFSIRCIKDEVIQSLTLTDPNGGNKLRTDEEYYIQWWSENVDSIDIDYTTNNGDTWINIATKQPASGGNYLWRVPNTPSEQCKVRIKDSNGTIYDESNTVFRIVYASLQLIQPNGGETLNAGSEYEIKWSSADIKKVTLAYSTDNGENWEYIGSDSAHFGSFQWVVPNTPSNQCRIIVKEYYQAIIGGKESFLIDTSDNVFSIELNPCPGIPTVEYNGKTYNTVQIGDQCWLRENLNVGVMINGSFNQTNNSIIEKYCYDNDTSNCNIYGGLYQWNEAMQYAATQTTQGICPDGWHIPTDSEWKKMEMYLGMSESNANQTGWRGTDEGDKLKFVSSWNNEGEGTNESGFAALAGGYLYYYNQSFLSKGEKSDWWTSSDYDESESWVRRLSNEYSPVYRYHYNKNNGQYVRCVKDEIPPDSLTLISPNGGEEWVAGKVYSIEWKSTANVGVIKIEYSTNSGAEWNYIGDENAYVQSFEWTVPNTPSTNCLVRIYVYGEEESVLGDTSDTVFKILPPAPSVSSINPDSGVVGSTIQIWGANLDSTKFVTFKSDNENTVTLTGHTDFVRSVAISPDGQIVASGARNDTEIRLSRKDDGTLLKKLTGHTNAVVSLIFNSDGTQLISGSWDQTIKVWNVSSGSLIKTINTGSGINSIALNSKKNIVASAHDDYTVKLWDLINGALIRTLTGHTSAVQSVAFSHDGKKVAAGEWNSIVRVWDANSGSIKREFTGHETMVFSTAFTSDDRKLVSGDNYGNVKVWDLVDGYEVFGWNSGHVRSLAISPDDSTVVTGGGNNVKVNNINTGTLIADLDGHTDGIMSVCLSKDGTTIVSGGFDKTVKVWRTRVPADFEILSEEQMLVTTTVPEFTKNGQITLGTISGTAISSDTFKVLQPILKVTHPDGGEKLRVGKIYNIKWNSNYSTQIKIDYSTDGGNGWLPVSGSLPAQYPDGYDWEVPNTPSANCLIRITDLNDSLIYDLSDSTFEIFKPNVTLFTPNGGENWLINSMQDITWSSTNVDTVKLEYSTNNGQTWIFIDNFTPAETQNYGWIIPETTSPYCKVRISQLGYPDIFDTSDNVFRIINDSLEIGLIAHYPFTGNHLDYSGYDNHGTNHGVTLTEDRFGNATSAYYFPGNEWISVPSSSTLNGITNGFTLSAWIKPEALANQNILNKWFDGTQLDRGFFFNTNNTGKLWAGIIDDENTLLSSKNIIANRWQYVVTTWSDTNLKLYIDGKLAAERTTSGAFVNQNVVLGIGADPNPGPKNFFKGIIDDIRIYNRNLSEAEIEKLYGINGWEDPYIQVFSPNNEESIEIGTSYDITWEQFNVESVKIEYSTNSGTDWILVESSVPAYPSSYEWTVPGTPSTECLVRLTDAYDPALGDTSGMFEIYQRYVNVVAPNGGEELKVGTNYYISWESSHIDYVDIDYSTDNGNTWLFVTGGISADEGSHVWNIPDSPSENCLVRITESGGVAKDDYVSDVSDSLFTIYKPSLTLLTPNGGEEWRVDNTYEIEWSSTYLEFVALEYSIDAGLTWDFLDVVPAGNGSYEWTIPNTPSNQCKVKIYESGGGTIGKESVISDTSDNVFTIYQPTITVFQPNGGERWRVGEDYPIQWSSTYIETVGIEYTTDNGNTWIFIDQVPPNSEGFIWTIPDTPSEECKVRIFEVGEVNPVESFVSDTSDNVFTIYKPTLTVTQPNGRERFRVDNNYSIEWQSSDVDYIDIDYSTNNGASWINLDNSVLASTGEYSWTIPDTPSDLCLVRITESGGVKDGLIYDISDSTFTIFKPYLSLSTPNGGEKWRVGNTYDIKWVSYDLDLLALEYSTDAGLTWDFLDVVPAGNGSYEWTIPNTPSNQCKVKIYESGGGTIRKESVLSDTSDNVFTIYQPTITVIQPNGGERWRAGEDYDILWSSTYLYESVGIEYSTDNGQSWIFIDQVPTSHNGYNWTIPDTPSEECKVRIYEMGGELNPIELFYASDTSDNAFTIYKPTLTVIQPNGGEEWRVGAQYSINWESSNIDYVDIEYSTDNGNSWLYIAAATTASNGTYLWTIPDTPSEECLIRINESGGVKEELISDVSDSIFTIFKPSITVVTPNGGEEWRVDNTYSIKWTSSYVSSVKLEYTTDNGNTWLFINNALAEAGTYEWLIPDTPSELCKVKITDNYGTIGEALTFDTSDNVFRIYKPSITVIQPNGGEQWRVDEYSSIDWSSSDVNNVSLEYTTNNGNSWNFIANVSAGSGTYNWLIPDTPSDQCKVRIIEFADKEMVAGDTSDAVFTIFRPVLTIISPNGGEEIEVRKNHLIQWNADRISYIDIYYSTNNGSSWNNIVSAHPASSLNYSWLVPNTPSENCKLLITEAGVKDGIMTDTSDAAFTIFDPERNALIALYNATGGDNWSNKTNWKTFEPLSTWYGVTLTEDRVTGINLSNNNLSGVVPKALENITELEELILAFNSITGWYPPSSGTFTKLKILNLSHNQITGDIPEAFLSLVSLKDIYLNQNNITGTISASFGNLINLVNLNLANNTLTGNLPIQLFNLNGLKELNLSGNQLSGSIPSQIGNLVNLEQLNFGVNQFTGSIPAEINTLTNLKEMNLHSNLFNGTIPTGLWGLTSLQVLDLSSNEITGSIPTNIGGLINLSKLNLSGNSFIGGIPTQIGGLTNLLFLSLANNQFDGTLPTQTANLVNLRELYISKNSFVDLPVLTPLINLQKLHVEENRLTFEDIEPNLNVPGVEFIYSPQAIIGKTIDTIVVAGSSLTLKMNVGGVNNFYQWKKNGVVIPNANDTLYIIQSVSINDTGSYTCEITNSLATALTLYSNPVNVALQERIELTSPNGGEKLRANSSFNITWSLNQFKKNGFEQNGTVKIEFSTNSGTTWSEIVSSHPMNTLIYNWTVPYLASNQCLIRISDNEFEQNSDVSDSAFTVYIPSLTVITPNGGEFYPVSKQRNISWITENVNFVKIDYTTNNGETWINIVSSLPATQNNYIWTVPNTPSAECKIRVYDVEAVEFFDTSDSIFTIVVPVISVTAPNGGEDWQVNLPKNITWTSSHVDSVTIQYSTDNGQSWTTIVPSIAANIGTYNWIIPNTPSTQSKVRILDVENVAFGDTSDSVFRIFLPAITVTSPNGGEDWQVNTQKTITWTSVDVGNVKIEYTTDNGQSWLLIANSVPATPASYDWLIPNTPSTQAKVRITDVAFPDIGDTSNNVFRIFLPAIAVTSPNGGENWQVNLTKTITWTSVDVANVKIEYTTDNGQSWLLIANTVPALPASYDWLIPNTPSTQAKVRITDVAFPDIGDTSNNVFRIFLPAITVTSPNGGEDWQVNLTKTITWTSVDVANVKIEYTTNNGQSWLEIVNSVPATPASYEWMIPNTPSTQAKVRITDVAFPDIGDTSNNVFRIFLPAITVTSPNGSENWQVNLPKNITWTSVDVANVRIEYTTNNGQSWLEIVNSVPAAPASFEWIVPNTPSAQAKVRITDVAFPNIGDTSDNVFRIFRPGVTVTAPNGGEQWQVGTTQNITWVSADVANVKIDYSTNNGISWNEVIASTVAGPGSFPWLIPDTESNQCKVRIIDIAYPEYADTSDGTFRIFMPKVTVTAPNGGEQWQVGQQYNITWTSSDMANVKIDYTTNSGSNWINITNSTPAVPGSFAWTIPNTPSQLVKVRITDVANPTIGDSSDAIFRIFLPALTVATPNGAEQWRVGTQQNITWTSADVANVKIEYTTNNGTNWINIVNSVPASPALYQWTIPNTPSTQCKVRITNVAFPNIGDTSDNVFRIFLPAVTVVSPNGGEQWQANTQKSITWTSTDMANVKIEYSTNNGTNWIAVINSTPASPASYAWTVPSTPSTQCRVRVSDASNSAINDASNNVFTIFLPVITVVTPNGGERWLSGSVQNVTYTSQHVDTVAIEYSTNSGQSWIAVGASAASGQYQWTIPNTASENCKIRIMHKSNYTIGDTSNAVFAIYSPAVTVVTPNGGEQWLIGSQQLIKWTSKDIDTLRIELSTNSGVSWISVIGKVPAALGEYLWTIPDISSEQCLIRLTDNAIPTIRDVSNNIFTIFKPRVTIIKPVGGEKFKVGTTQNISWTSSNSQNVRIEYTSDAGSTWNLIVESVSASAVNYNWTIPNTPAPECKIRILDVTYPSFGDTTDLSFSIVAPSMRVVSPNGGEKLIVGKWETIRWTSYFVDSLRIEYSYDNGTNWYPVAQSVIVDTGTAGFSWLIPETQSQQCLVRIFDLALPTFGDTSDLVFAIFKPTVTLITPNGGEKYFVGIAYDITWTSSEVDSVKLEYSVNDGSSWMNIADAIPAELGTYNWMVPNTPSTICKVRITDVRFNDVTDRSDNNFTIAVLQLPIYVAIHQNPALTRYCDLVVISDSLLESAPYVEARSPKDTLVILMNQITNSNYAYSGAYKFDSTGVYSFYVKIKASIGVEKDTVRNFTVVLAKPGVPSNIRSLDLLANLSIAPELIQEETYFVSDINKDKKETTYLFSPNRSFAQPIPLEIIYSPDVISDPAKLFIYQMQEGGWIPLRSQVYPKNQRVKSYVNNLGKFKIEVDESFTGSNIVPDVYTLKQNYPNPFNPQTTIEFDLREDAVTSLIIYDILGRQVKTIYNDFQLAGSYRIQWDGRNDYNETVASGIYFYRLYSGEFISVKKMVLIR